MQAFIFARKKDATPNLRGFPVYCRITYQRKKAELYTGENCMPDKWNDAAGAPLIAHFTVLGEDQRLFAVVPDLSEQIEQQLGFARQIRVGSRAGWKNRAR